MRARFVCFCLGLSAFSALPADAQEGATQKAGAGDAPSPRRLWHGHKGELVIGGSSHLTLGGSHYARRSILSVLPEHSLGFAFSPSAAFFVLPYLGVGVIGDVALVRAPGTTAWSLAVGPQAQAHVSLARHVGLMPALAFLYRRVDNDDTLVVAIKVMAAIHLNRNLSVTVGPQVSQDVYRHRAPLRVTNYGLYVGLLGWLF